MGTAAPTGSPYSSSSTSFLLLVVGEDGLHFCSLCLHPRPHHRRLSHFLRHIPRRIIAFDELKTDYKNPIDQCGSLNPLVLPEYLLHLFFNVLFLFAGEWFTLILNLPLIAYHVHRYMKRPVM